MVNLDAEKDYIVTAHMVIDGVEIVTTLGMKGLHAEWMYRDWQDGKNTLYIYDGHSRWSELPSPIKLVLKPINIVLLEVEEPAQDD